MQIEGLLQGFKMQSFFIQNKQKQNSFVQPFYELLEDNLNQSTFLLAANSYTNSLWDASLFFYENAAEIGSTEPKKFRWKMNSTITNLRFITDKQFLLTNSFGNLEILATQSNVWDEKCFRPYKIAKKTEHSQEINALQIFEKKAITASSDRSIRFWDFNCCDLISFRQLPNAHTDVINDISCNEQNNYILYSCSTDKTFCIWDRMQSKPLIGLHKNSLSSYTACKWLCNNLIYVGDESGKLHIFDERKFSVPVKSIEVFNRPIYRMKYYSKALAIIGNTNEIKIFNVSKENINLLYSNDSADDLVRDICWIKDKTNTNCPFYTVGYNKHVQKHEIT